MDMLPLEMIAVACALGYGLGSIPFGLILSNMLGGIDIRKVGSGNIGATNVLRTGRKGLAIATLLLDGGKGALALYLGQKYISVEYGAIAGLAAVIGHCFPVWLRFKGGKGVATGIATIAALNPIGGLVMATSWLFSAFMFRYSSLAALISYGAACGYSLLFRQDAPIELMVVFSISLLSSVRHHDNIKRLISGTESQINFRKNT